MVTVDRQRGWVRVMSRFPECLCTPDAEIKAIRARRR
jgi:hypothetical protein